MFYSRCIIAFSLFFLAIAYGLQYGYGLNPCPLCLMQRFSLMLVVAFSFAEIFWQSAKKLCYFFEGGSLFFILAGIYFSSRQLFLQLYPTATHSCLPALDFMIDNHFPAIEIIKSLFLGSGDCANISFTLLGLSLASWSLMGFILLFSLSLTKLYKRYKG